MKAMLMRLESLEKRDRTLAGIISGAFMLLLLVLFFFLTAFTTLDPPPGEQYVELSMADYGTSNAGSGNTETETPSEKVEEAVEEAVSTPTETEVTPTPDIPTQTESEVSVPANEQPADTQEIPDETPEPDPQPSNSLMDALNNINTSGGGGGGDGDDETAGNEGNSDGNIDGKGVVGGNEDFSYDLGGRGILGTPANVNPLEEGRVVLKIYVDRQGNILSSEPDYGRSNTTSQHLFKLAKEAIKTIKFQAKPAGAVKQKGSVTFNFKLK